jgi:hypothetical protein
VEREALVERPKAPKEARAERGAAPAGLNARSTGSQTRARSDEAKINRWRTNEDPRRGGGADEGRADGKGRAIKREVAIEQLSGAGRKRKRNHTGEEKV